MQENEMSRGITENDVWIASDALLLEGARPTIERVRQKIGRGSPNTVSPYLDSWFKSLGARIKEPGKFLPSTDVPDPIVQVAKHLWETAQAETRRDFDARLTEAMAAAVANVEAEKERAAVAEAAAFEASAKAARLVAELSERNALLDQEKLSLATAQANLANAERQVSDLGDRLAITESQLVAERKSADQQVAAALERSSAAERRALLDIDAERTARSKAEKRADSLERKVEGAYAEARASERRRAEESANAKAAAERLAAELDAARDALVEAKNEITRMSEALSSEQRAAAHARGCVFHAIPDTVPL